MFTMEIYNQLTKGDLTKGHRVAGTGTIDAEGKVGAIGGVKHKIVAADREDAEIFSCRLRIMMKPKPERIK